MFFYKTKSTPPLVEFYANSTNGNVLGGIKVAKLVSMIYIYDSKLLYHLNTDSLSTLNRHHLNPNLIRNHSDELRVCRF